MARLAVLHAAAAVYVNEAPHSHVSLSFSSGVGAMSTELLLWQLSSVGSAPWLRSREQTSTRFLDAASWRGVNCHRSMALTHAPCWKTKITTKIKTRKMDEEMDKKDKRKTFL